MLLPLMFASCLENNLEDIEVYDGADITSVRGMYYYYNYTTTPAGDNIFDWGNISRQNVVIDDENNTVSIGIATPATANIDQFSPQKVVMMLTISTAATIEPIDNSAVLGIESDWTAGKINKYKITAANGVSKVWTVVVESYDIQ